MVDCDCTPQVTPWAITGILTGLIGGALIAWLVFAPKPAAIEAAAGPSKLVVERDASGRIVSVGGV